MISELGSTPSAGTPPPSPQGQARGRSSGDTKETGRRLMQRDSAIASIAPGRDTRAQDANKRMRRKAQDQNKEGGKPANAYVHCLKRHAVANQTEQEHDTLLNQNDAPGRERGRSLPRGSSTRRPRNELKQTTSSDTMISRQPPANEPEITYKWPKPIRSS